MASKAELELQNLVLRSTIESLLRSVASLERIIVAQERFIEGQHKIMRSHGIETPFSHPTIH